MVVQRILNLEGLEASTVIYIGVGNYNTIVLSLIILESSIELHLFRLSSFATVFDLNFKWTFVNVVLWLCSWTANFKSLVTTVSTVNKCNIMSVPIVVVQH